jgi:hypothetical protein
MVKQQQPDFLGQTIGPTQDCLTGNKRRHWQMHTDDERPLGFSRSVTARFLPSETSALQAEAGLPVIDSFAGCNKL